MTLSPLLPTLLVVLVSVLTANAQLVPGKSAPSAAFARLERWNAVGAAVFSGEPGLGAAKTFALARLSALEIP
jgi:hypothetical protein